MTMVSARCQEDPTNRHLPNHDPVCPCVLAILGKYESTNPRSNLGAGSYSFSKVCSLPLANSSRGVTYADFFHRWTSFISADEHASNLRFLRAHVRTYFEFPPLYDACSHIHSPEPRSIRAPRGQPELLNRSRAVQLISKGVFDPPSWSSDYPPYVQLTTRGVDMHLLRATTPWRLSHFSPTIRWHAPGAQGHNASEPKVSHT